MIPGSKRHLSRFGWMVGASGAVLVGLGTVPHETAVVAQPAVETQVSFANDVMPILQQRCVECHGGETTEAGLSLTSHEGVMAGSDFGAVVEAGNPDASFLLEMVVEGDMPEEGDPVPENEIEILRSWIEAGAPNN